MDCKKCVVCLGIGCEEKSSRDTTNGASGYKKED